MPCGSWRTEVGSMRGIRERLQRDDGMTIVEIMAAAVIMFIILTGVLGLVGRTTMMGAQATEKNILTNALNAYIESVHALPFEDVALVADGGVLEPVVTQISNGWTITIETTVTPVVGNDALKKLGVTITGEDGRGKVTTTSTEVTIRDREQFLTMPPSTTGPAIEWGSLMPPDRSVAWGRYWAPLGLQPDEYVAGSNSFYIDVSAAAEEGKTIASVQVSYGFPCEDTLTDRQAVWAPATQTWNAASELFVWDTDEVEMEEDPDNPGVFNPVRQVQDGWRTLRATVTDNATPARSSEITRYYLVDNFAPPAPEYASSSVKSAYEALVSWPKVMDGSHGAEGYQIRWYQQGLADTDPDLRPDDETNGWDYLDTTNWTDASAFDGEVMTRSFASVPLSRYHAQVRAASPRFRSDWVETTFISRPLLTGEYLVEVKTTGNPKYQRVTSKLSVTAPTFPTTGAVTYKFYRLEGSVPTLIQSGSSTTCQDLVNSPDHKVFPVRSYYVDIVFTPAGFGGGAATTLRTNTVSTKSAASGTYTFEEGTW